MFFTNFIALNRIQSFLKLNTNMKKLLMLFALVAFVGIGTANAQVKTAAKEECAKTCSKAKGTAMKAEVKEAPAKATSATAETEKASCSSAKSTAGAACCSKDKAKGTAMKASVKDAPAKASGEAAAKKECSKTGSSCCSKTKAAAKEEQ